MVNIYDFELNLIESKLIGYYPKAFNENPAEFFDAMILMNIYIQLELVGQLIKINIII